MFQCCHCQWTGDSEVCRLFHTGDSPGSFLTLSLSQGCFMGLSFLTPQSLGMGSYWSCQIAEDHGGIIQATCPFGNYLYSLFFFSEENPGQS